MTIKVKAKVYDWKGNFVETENAILDTGSSLSWVYDGIVRNLELFCTGKVRESIAAKGERVKGKIALASVEIKFGVEAYGPFDVLLGVVPYRFAETEEMRRKGEKGIELVLGNDYMEEASLYVSRRGKIVRKSSIIL